MGKTTTAIHLAHALAIQGARVAVVDLDPQGNAMIALQGMHGGSPEAGGRVVAVAERFWACSPPHSGPQPEADLATTILRQVEELNVDWLIADCPPRMDAWGRIGLQLCERVIVPVQAEFLAMHGLSQIMSTVKNSGSSHLAGVLLTMVDSSEQICNEVVANLRSHLGEVVYESVILRDSSLVEAASHGKTVFAHCPGAKAALCYGELFREVFGG